MNSIVYLGLGTNIGDRDKNIAGVLKRLKDEEGIEILSRSSFYNTKPVGGPPQDDYLNGVIKIRTNIVPSDLIQVLKKIEKDMGRTVSGKDHPRIIDIDILLYDDLVINADDLIVPHPRMHEREFVLKGFESIDPEVVHPVLNRTISELYSSIK